MSETEIAWFAGIFEGEGTFETSKRSTVRMRVGMTDRDIVDRVNSLFPGVISVRPAMKPVKSHYSQPRPIYVWTVAQGVEVARIVNLILPWLGERRGARAREVLAHIAKRPAPGMPRKTHCAQGHELNDDNLVRRGGASPYWRCRTCRQAEWTKANVKRRSRKAGQVISA